MAIRKLLLPLPGPVGGEAALATGLMVARLWDAHLSVMHVRVDDQRAQAVRALFNGFMATHGVTIGEASPGGGAGLASFAWVSGREADQVVHQARLSDLIIVPHPQAGEDVSSSDMLHAVLFDSGRPVLIAPHVVPPAIGTRICLGWNGTAESASAVYVLTPWLKRASAVRILSIGSGSTVGEVNGSVGASFPHRMLEALQERRPNVRFDLTVQGGRGMTAETMLGLLRQTLPGGKFPLVIWQTGTVEAVHALRPDQLQETLQEGLRLVRAAGGDLILVDAQFSRFLRANADLDMYEAVMQHIDAMPGAVLFRRYELTRSWANEGRLDLERVRKPDREKAIQVLNTCLGSALAQFALSGAQKEKP
ncbi:MAG: hypothetical protein J0H99_10665 [Rhodospirillales bacterium]|nr:hypothetical protein [Rhodospirillales bacterium]